MEHIFAKKELIYTVYQEQSISKAAKKLFISQPALSTMVKQVEEHIGVPLFDRSCKPLHLTEAGEAYIRAVEAIHRIEQDFDNYLSAASHLQTGSLGVGGNQLFSSMVIPRLVSRFIGCYPGIEISLVDANSAELEAGLKSGKLDLILDNKPLSESMYERKVFCREQLLLAVPASFAVNQTVWKYRLTHQDIAAQRDWDEEMPAVPLPLFSDTPFILMTKDNDTRERTDAIFRIEEFRPRVLLNIERLSTLFNFVCQETAASVVSDTLVLHSKYDENKVVYYKLPGELAKREVYIQYKRDGYRSPVMKRFIQMALEPQ